MVFHGMLFEMQTRESNWQCKKWLEVVLGGHA